MKKACCIVAFLSASAAVVPAQLGSVVSSHRIKPGSSGFVGPLAQDSFGTSLAALGDLNGDGTVDLAVGAPTDGDGGNSRGALWILFLDSAGAVIGEQKISQTQGGFTGALNNGGEFGRKLASVGDLDGDGLPELAVLSRAPARLWVVALNANGTAKSTTENLFTDPVFVPAAQPGDFVYADMAALGDLDGDGLGDLAIGAPRDSDGAHEAGAVWILRLAADGTIQATQKISQTHGGFAGTLPAESYFGYGLAQLDDLNGDGNRELAVLSPGSEFAGEIWVLFLDASEQVSSHALYGPPDYGLAFQQGSGTLVTSVSHYIAALGDLDGDGLDELVMGFPGSFQGSNPDGFTIAFLRTDGSVKKRLRIGNQSGGLGLVPVSYLGSSFAPLGDLNGDGALELAVGAPVERTSGVRTGAVWIVTLDPDVERNGSGVNPLTLSQTSDPVYGSNWTATLDCSGHGPGLAYLFGRSQPASGTLTPYGELLIGGSLLFQFQQPHLGTAVPFTTAVPPRSIALLDLPLFVQGVCTGAPGTKLSNALDVLVGE